MNALRLFATVILTVTFSPVFIEAGEDAGLTQLRQSWLRARNRAVTPIDQKYHAELQKLITIYTRAGDLESAVKAKEKLVKVDQLIKAASQPVETKTPEKQPAEATLKGKWTWRTQSQGVEFNEGGQLLFYWNVAQPPNSGQWAKHSDTTFLITLKNGNRYQVTVPENSKEANVKALDQSLEDFKITRKE